MIFRSFEIILHFPSMRIFRFVKYECFKRKEEKDVRSFLMESFLIAKLDL